MKRPIFFIAIVFLTVIALSIVHISVANQVSTTGSILSKLQTGIDDLKRENAILHEKVLKESSLMNVSEKAEKSGFVNLKSTAILSTPLPLARR